MPTLSISGQGSVTTSSNESAEGFSVGQQSTETGGAFTTASATTPPASAQTHLAIKLTPDQSVFQEFGANYQSSTFWTAVTQAANFFESTFINPITIDINVGWGEVNGTTVLNGGGESERNFAPYVFGAVKTALVNNEQSANDAAGVANLQDPGNGGADFEIPDAEAKAMGLILPAGAPAIDGWIGFASGLSPSDPSFTGFVEHEISEVMGRVGITDDGTAGFSVLDLFRYFGGPPILAEPRSATGPNGQGTTYFSKDGGKTQINTFSRVPGDDPGSDWAGNTLDAFDALITLGQNAPISAGDISEMEVLGYDLASTSPPPPPPPPAPPPPPPPPSGSSELFWQSTTGEVDYWTMQGNAVASTHFLANPGTGWHLVGAANFGDGTSDLLWQSTAGEVDYWTMQGNAAVSTHFLANPGTGWHLVGGANFGDGTSDLLWQSTSGEVDYWTMQGNAVASTHFLANPGTGWHLVGAANFGDGTSDLLWRNTTGEVDYWTMRGNAVVSTHFLANPGTGWHLVGATNFGDGTSDLLWQSISGEVDYWTMQGNAVVSTHFLANPGTGWQLTGGLVASGVATAASGDVQTASPAVTAGGTGAGASTVIGAAGDTVTGGSGADLINGTAGSQVIAAGSGATTVWGGAADTITGGSGQLTVAIDHANSPGAEIIGDSGIKGSDTVTGFSQAAGDRILFPNETTAAINGVVASAQSSNGNTLITLPDGATMTLVGIPRIDNTFFS